MKWHTNQVALIDAVESTSPEITQLIANLPTSAIQSDDLATISDYIASKSSENLVLFNIFNLLFNIKLWVQRCWEFSASNHSKEMRQTTDSGWI